MSKIIVKAKPNPFKSEIKEFELECGSLNELFYQLHTGLSVNHARFMVNGEIINDVEFTPNSGDETLILVVPGGGSTKDTGTTMKAAGWWLTAVGVIIAIAFSWTGIGAGIGIALIGAGLGMTAGGQALLSIKIPKNREEPKQDPSIKGSRNRENQGGYVPFLLGKHLFYPDVAAKPYTIIEGQNQYLVMLYCCGFNNMEIDKSTLKIGDTLLTEYAATKNIDRILDLSDDNVKLELIANGAESVLYPERVNEIQLNAIIKNKRDDDTSGAIIKTTVNNTEKINVDIFFYNGLGKYDDENNLKSTSVDIRAYYKLDGALDSAYQLLGNFVGSSNVISGSELKTKRYTVTKTGLAAGKYTVKIERVTGDSDAGKVIDQVYVGSIRCYIKGRVIDADTQKHLQIVALKVKATEQLNNVIDSLNMIATAVFPDYTGSGSGQSAWIKRKTVNPSSALLYAFQGNISQEPVSNDLIDWKSLEKWHIWCDQHKYECNLFVANDYALSDIANMITSTARADFVKIDGLISVIQDIAKPSHINLFTPRNTISYQQIIRFADIPDAVSCEFINAEADYQQDEIVVYNTPTGIYQKEAEKKQNINIPGITNAEQAFKIVRYKYACLTNRPRQHIIKLDIEYLACTKGDWIKYAGDTALTGLAFTRITSRLKVAENDAFIYGFETDSTFTLPQGENYAARIRKSDGKLLVYDIRPSGLEKNYFELLTPITQTDVPESGDLCVIGIKGKETLDLLVMDITPSDDFTATLKCVDYAPEIFGVDNPDYVIPPFESKITTGGYQDSGVVNPNDWKYFSTFNDSVIKPERPLGGGSDNGWHLLQTTESKWISYKTAKNLSSGVWANPIATSKGVEDNILGDYPEAAPPEQVKNINAVAWKDSVHIAWNYQAKPGLTNTIRKYIIEISKDNGITWGRHNSSEASFIYQFNRKTDGYPEKTDLASWLVQVKAVNIYGKESIEWSSSSGIDTSDYKTWKLAPVSIKATALKDTIEINWNKQDDVYGAIVYDVYVKGTLITSVTQNQYAYTFNREVDGYPEADELKTYQIKIIARNEAGRASSVMPPDAFDLTNYKTWKLIPLAANATAYRDNIIVEYEKASDAIYGTVEYSVFVNGGNSGPSYYFNREIDGYPEKAELEAWEIKVVTSNPAMSMQTVLQGADFDFTNYKTWKPSKPNITVKAISTGVEVSWQVYDGSYYGTPVYSIFKNAQKIKTSLYQSPYTYYFNRKSDGYPEAADMENFKFAVQVENESGKNAVSEEIVADTTEYKTWHITPPIVTAKADEGLVLVGWEAKPSAETAAYYYGNPKYDVLRGDTVIAANIFANTFDYHFNAKEEGYPEKAELEAWQFTIRVRTEAEQIDTAPIAPDVSSYKGYTPSIPEFTAIVNGRSIMLSWKPDTDCYGYIGCQIQVAKAYKVIGGEYTPITDPDELLWFSPALGLNPYASLENYKTGDEGGMRIAEGGTITFTVPLFGQDGAGANSETQYAYRLASQTVAKRSGWTTEHYCLARGVSAYDVVKAWKLTDSGEKVQLDGALGVYQIFVKELAALSANLGLITDGNIIGSEENYWAVSDFVDDTTKEIIRHKGEFRVGGKDKYIKVKPVIENGVVTDYDIDFVVGKFSVSATGTKIEGGYFVVYDRDNNLLFEITPEGIKSRVNEGYLEDTGIISKEIDVTAYGTVLPVLKHGKKVYSIIAEADNLTLVSIDSDNTVLIEDTFASEFVTMPYSIGYDGESITFLLKLDDTDPLIIQGTYCKYNLTTKSKTYMSLTEEHGVYPMFITKTGVIAFEESETKNVTPVFYYDFTVQSKVLFPSVFAGYDMLSGFTEDSQFLYFPIYGDYATQIIRLDKDSGVPSFCAFHAVKTNDSQLYSDLSKRQMEIDGDKIRFFGDFKLQVDSQTYTSPKQSIIELDFLSLVWYQAEVAIESVRFDVWIAGDRNELEQNFCANTGSGFSYGEASKTLSVYDKIDTPPNETVFYTQKGTLSKISRQIPVNADTLYMFSNVIKEQSGDNTLYTYLVSDHIKNEGMLMNFQRFWKTTVPITTDKKMYASGIGFTGIFFNKGNGNYRYYLDTGGFLEFSPAGNLVGNGEKGDRGEPGQQGIQGDAGIQGIQGLQGEKGSTGAKGEKGDKGDAGIQGIKGDKGDTGNTGAKGNTGPQGAQGIKGDKGDTGPQGIIPKLPVGYLLESVVNTNPATFLGYGTWVYFGQGRVTVGISTAESEFNTVRKTGGSKFLQSHLHPIRMEFGARGDPAYNPSLGLYAQLTGTTAFPFQDYASAYAGGGNSQNLQPYITTYKWERVA